MQWTIRDVTYQNNASFHYLTANRQTAANVQGLERHKGLHYRRIMKERWATKNSATFLDNPGGSASRRLKRLEEVIFRARSNVPWTAKSQRD